MKETGKVIKTYNGFADVRFIRKSACGENCANCMGGCKEKEHIARVKNAPFASIGDDVLVYTNPKKAYFSMFLIFILPVIIFTFIFSLVYIMAKNKIVSFFAAFFVLTVYFFLIKHYEKIISPVPEICEIVKKGGNL